MESRMAGPRMKAPPSDIRIVVKRVIGSPHTSHTLYYRGQVLRSQLSPMTEADIADHVRVYLNPPVSRLDRMADFWKNQSTGGKAGRPKKATVQSNGFVWKNTEEE
jgi:hypothetical protein